MAERRQTRRGGAWICAGLLLLAAALLLTVCNLWDADRADRAAQSISRQLEQTISGNVQARTETEGESAAGAYEDPNREMPTVEIDGETYIGELEIPSLDLTLPVMENWDMSKLKRSPCRFSGSYYADDLVIAGHNYARHFSAIKWIDIGAEVLFTNVEGEVFRYQVSNLETIRPDQVEEMITGDWDLTLFTCTTGGQARCAVRCDRIES